LVLLPLGLRVRLVRPHPGLRDQQQQHCCSSSWGGYRRPTPLLLLS
jgi:hypothetical protein